MPDSNSVCVASIAARISVNSLGRSLAFRETIEPKRYTMFLQSPFAFESDNPARG